MAIGDPLIKRQICEHIPKEMRFPVLVHPRALMSDPSSIIVGKGTIICAGVVLTTDISISEHVLINLNTTIGHDCIIGAFSSIMPGVNVAGEVTIGTSVLLGSGSNIRNRVRIGDRCKVGMGAVVIRNVNDDDTVVGVPAKTNLTNDILKDKK